MNGNKPIRTFKAGAIKASVFENLTLVKGVETKIFNVIVSKTYKDKDDHWKSTHSFSVFYEIPKVLLVLQKAYEYVVMHSSNEEQGEGENHKD
jgi:hypothetical protein